MKTKFRIFPTVFLLVVLCMGLLPVSAFAVEGVEVSIPVSVNVTGEKTSSDETYTIVLQAMDDAPMPSESTITITGNGTASFPAIYFSTPGIYEYKVTQLAGSHERGHYDATVYYVRVSVTNGENGGLESVVAAHIDEQMTSAKREISFENSYDPVPTAPETEATTETTAEEVVSTEEEESTAATTEAKSKTTAKKKEVKSETKKTGDDTNTGLWITMLAIACCGIVLVLLERYRAHGRQNSEK